jgi:hypothetical protein
LPSTTILESRWQRPSLPGRDSGFGSAGAITRFRWRLQMLATPKGLSDEKAARMMVALREGRTLRKFGVKPPRLEAYFAAYPEYAREARPLIEANARAACLRKGANYRDKTHCKHGHPLSGDNLYIAPKRKERKCRTCVQRRQSAPRPADHAQIERATAALIAGLTIKRICWGTVGVQKVSEPILPFSKLKLHRRLNPDYDRFVVLRLADHNSKAQLRRWRTVRNDAVRDQNDDFYEIRATLPANFPDRDDVVSNIFEAILNGSLQRDQVRARIRDFIAIHNRTFSTAYPKFGGKLLHSLDAPIFDDGTTTRGDTVSRGLWD